MVHAVMIDFLESVLPVPSSFELPQDYRNKSAFLSFFHPLAFWLGILILLLIFQVFTYSRIMALAIAT